MYNAPNPHSSRKQHGFNSPNYITPLINIGQPSQSLLSHFNQFSQPYITYSNSHYQHPHNPHNLLTIVSAASIIKKENTGHEILVQNPLVPVPPAYIPVVNHAAALPHAMFLPPHVMPSNMGEHPTAQKSLQESQLQVDHNVLPVSEHGSTRGESPIVNSSMPVPLNLHNCTGSEVGSHSQLQPGTTEEIISLGKSSQGDNIPDSSFSTTKVDNKPVDMSQDMTAYNLYNSNDQHIPCRSSNSLSQLASIAVAAADPRDLGGVEPSADSHNLVFDPSHIPPPVNNQVPQVNWMTPPPGQPTNITGTECLPTEQTGVFVNDGINPSNLTCAPPIRSGQDPFIIAVSSTVSEGISQHNLNKYSRPEIIQNLPLNRNCSVKWQDHHDNTHGLQLNPESDPMMREAVNVADPSNILPNSMMGGTPTGAFCGSSNIDRPFRQRHHSEGSALTKRPSLLKQILHSSVPTVKLRPGGLHDSDISCSQINLNKETISEETNSSHLRNNCMQNEFNIPLPNHSHQNSIDQPKAECWAEPKPVQWKTRYRRHSADCRLMNQSSLYMRKHESANKPSSQYNKTTERKPYAYPHNNSQSRFRNRPPPLVIPSSVNSFSANGYNGNLHQSYLHQQHYARRYVIDYIQRSIPIYHLKYSLSTNLTI